ncbi:MAG: MobC family plasmid mobilization relaxosome protein [Lachnospiraceae bacterium]|nr:MobC family plasmid mobilization relaxosome protein [Ruminococcus sp.]MCM1276895.1 MobC family plasmid mobilization relaxosome protein [Lachnospiraceae bacterium]
MRKYKQVKEKKVIYSLDEWEIIEQRAAALSLKTGTYIRRISLDGQICQYNVEDITRLMNALRIIGNNINQIAAKANTIHDFHVNDIEELKSEVSNLCLTLSRLAFTERSSAA